VCGTKNGTKKSFLIQNEGRLNWQGHNQNTIQYFRLLEISRSAFVVNPLRLRQFRESPVGLGNPLVIEKAQVDAELIRLTRLRSAHAEEQYRIRTNLRRSHEDAEAFTGRLTNLRQDMAARQDTSGDKFGIELDGQVLDNRGIAGELIVRRAEKIKNRFGEDVRVGRFAGFDLFLRPTFNDNVEMIVRGKNSYAARVSDTALGTIRSLEANVQGFDERASRLEYLQPVAKVQLGVGGEGRNWARPVRFRRHSENRPLSGTDRFRLFLVLKRTGFCSETRRTCFWSSLPAPRNRRIAQLLKVPSSCLRFQFPFL
jgi:hypothetical protein